MLEGLILLEEQYQNIEKSLEYYHRVKESNINGNISNKNTEKLLKNKIIKYKIKLSCGTKKKSRDKKCPLCNVIRSNK